MPGQDEPDFPRLKKKHDTNDFFSQVNSLPRQLEKGYELTDDIDLDGRYSNIIITGMGGSFIAGFTLGTYLSELDIIPNHDYGLPRRTDDDSLVIAVSYSGGTEETISAYRKAHRKGCEVVSVTTGGKLEELSKMNETPLVKIPPGLEPRASYGYQLSALMKIIEAAGGVKGVKKELSAAGSSLKKNDLDGYARKVALKLDGKVPLIYSSELFHPIAYRWKIMMNENAGIMAFANSLPEMNHNEIMGFLNANSQADFHIIMLKSQDDSRDVQKRMKVTKEEARNNGIDVAEIGVKGNSLLSRMMSAAMIGDLSSYYLGLVYGKDPRTTEIIDSVKKKL